MYHRHQAGHQGRRSPPSEAAGCPSLLILLQLENSKLLCNYPTKGEQQQHHRKQQPLLFPAGLGYGASGCWSKPRASWFYMCISFRWWHSIVCIIIFIRSRPSPRTSFA